MISSPTVTTETPFVFVIRTSARCTTLVDDSATVDPAGAFGSREGVGSAVPTASCAVATLSKVPVASGASVPCTTKLTDDPAWIVTMVANPPNASPAPKPEVAAEPEAEAPPPAHEFGAAAEQVHEASEIVGGKTSLTVVATAAEGPSLNTEMIHSTPMPATTGEVTTVFVTRRSA
jgi:hypothetical protein